MIDNCSLYASIPLNANFKYIALQFNYKHFLPCMLMHGLIMQHVHMLILVFKDSFKRTLHSKLALDFLAGQKVYICRKFLK